LNSVSGSVNAFTSVLAILLPALAIGDDYNPMQRYSLEHEGVEREYFVHVPKDAKGTLPVVLGLHGYASTATGFQYAHDLNAHADKAGYIVVYPQATHFMVAEGSPAAYRATTWNSYSKDNPDRTAGPHCTAESAKYACPPGCGEGHACQWEPCTDDVAFIDRVLDEVQAGYDTDSSRYYVLGVSSGGIMTIRIACDLSARLAAAAPIVALQPRALNVRHTRIVASPARKSSVVSTLRARIGGRNKDRRAPRLHACLRNRRIPCQKRQFANQSWRIVHMLGWIWCGRSSAGIVVTICSWPDSMSV